MRTEGLDVLTQHLQLAGRPLKTLDTMTHSVQVVMHCCVCVCTCVHVRARVRLQLCCLFSFTSSLAACGGASQLLPLLLLQLQVYLKLFLVYLMNGCLGEALGGGAQSVSTRTLM